MSMDYSKALDAHADRLSDFNPFRDNPADLLPRNQPEIEQPPKNKKKKITKRRRKRHDPVERLEPKYPRPGYDPKTSVTPPKHQGLSVADADAIETAKSEAWELRLKGMKHTAICKKLSISMTTLKTYLRSSLQAARSENADMAGRWLDIQLKRQEGLRFKAHEILEDAETVKDKIACVKSIGSCDAQIAQLVGLIGPRDSQRSPSELTGDREAVLSALADRLLGLFAMMDPGTRQRLLDAAELKAADGEPTPPPLPSP